MLRDSVGNTYDRPPPKPPNHTAKAAKPGPKHGRKSRYTGPKKPHGISTGKRSAATMTSQPGVPKGGHPVISHGRQPRLTKHFNRIVRETT